MAKVGRPRMYETPEAMQAKINDYLVAEPRPTVAGLAFFLGFSSRNALWEYEQIEEFSDTIKRARLAIEAFLEGRLLDGQVAGVIFNLKNNFGWQDRQVQELDVPQHVKDAIWGS